MNETLLFFGKRANGSELEVADNREKTSLLVSSQLIEMEIWGRSKTLTGLYLYSNEFTQLPIGLERLENLAELWLMNNKLTAIDVQGIPKTLTGLFVRKNYFLFGLFCLTLFRRSQLRANQIKQIRSLSRLTKLQKLMVGENKLESFPDGVESLIELTDFGCE